MPTTFGREILGRDVVDQASDKLGVLADFRIDMSSGRIIALLVALENDLDPAMLPWPTLEGLLSVPVEEITEVGVNIQLAR
ncbi:MAG: PRC-barrel domain-containing protein [Candidatus Thalassarchaeum sp.]|nr:PRC-barrel domain-containing protein [Candidatus Thalassarchaeum sp.]MCS5531745.1 PRC-barrel domain-containing protein [Candidatus Poseidoniales archaeon]MEC9350683.1 PRC-barrel domain-containing protein [Candidatus Thermoplasmatota archaeon]MEC9394124.1 PRC-barrel domain-containing protein [Candidatus Thermoplasmatota archaeon]MEC9478256.1 PRC-barrel domain-containing protein [Candidatus Thermoplasmatota archaeon]|tara:strand:- start:66 stop:308 length:243 start_codon:yes stop_codon:yes gene_type:complete